MDDSAESKKLKSAMFELISKEITCNFCQKIIWKAPIFESAGGLIAACETCKNSSQENFQRSFKAEKMLLAFEINCKYKVDGCEFSGGPHNITQHEEGCEYRLVYCVSVECIGTRLKNFQVRDREIVFCC